MQVNIHEAKTHLSRLLERVAAGEEVILARDGTPCARIVPLATRLPRVPGLLNVGRRKRELGAAFFEPLPPNELALWNGTSPLDSAQAASKPKRAASVKHGSVKRTAPRDRRA
jgi:prevent-host-death family protein